MNKLNILFSSILLLGSIWSSAQSDTLYVHYEDASSNSSNYYNKMENDPETKTHFPFNGGASYRFLKKSGEFEYFVRFHFLSWSLDGPWANFDYLLISKKNISKIDFKDREWFDKTNYDDILGIFKENDPVIMLLDERYAKGDSVYLVRVVFNHSTHE